MKQTFASKNYAAKTFASGHWVGVGTGTIAVINAAAIDYRTGCTRPQYKATRSKPLFQAANTRPFYAGEAQDKWS